MDLSFLLTTVTLVILGYAGVTWVNSAYIAPRRAAKAAAPGAQTVKSKRRIASFRKGSRVLNVQNAVNVGSAQQEAENEPVNVQNVQAPAAQIAPPIAAAAVVEDGFTVSMREMVQLNEAILLYREGANVEQAVSRAFGVTKGGSEGWKRAKALFDAMTAPPGAAPVGTYTPLATPPARRRRAAR